MSYSERLVFVICVFVCVCVGEGGGALRSNVFTVGRRILISRPLKVFQRFERRSCFNFFLYR